MFKAIEGELLGHGIGIFRASVLDDFLDTLVGQLFFRRSCSPDDVGQGLRNGIKFPEREDGSNGSQALLG